MSTLPVTEPTPEELQTWLKVVADPKRLHIINLLMQGVQCNCDPQSTVINLAGAEIILSP